MIKLSTWIEKKISVIRLGILGLLFISMIIINVKLAVRIMNKEVEGYSVQTGDCVFHEIQKDEIVTEFKAVSPHIIGIRFWSNQDAAATGNIYYQILDSDENILVSREIDISKIWDEENKCMELEISGIEFDPGMRYFLRTEFNLEKPFEIMLDTNGIMHGQRYLVEYQRGVYFVIFIINVLMIGGILGSLRWGLNDKLFFVLTMVVGILVVFLTPPFSQDDEFRHFVRAYDWSYGGNIGYYAEPKTTSLGNVFIDEGGGAHLVELPKEISELRLVDFAVNYNQFSYFAEINTNLCIPKLISIFSQPEEIGMVEVAETATYWKGLESYWPQAIMIAFSRWIGLRSGLWYYSSAIGQVLASSVMCWLALKLVKGHKNLIWILSLVPVISLLRGSCNPDGLMIAEILLCLAIILHLREYIVNLRKKKGLGLFAIYLVFVYQIYKMKMPYALLCIGFLFLLRKENFAFVNWEWVKRHRGKLVCGVGIVVAVVMIYLIGIKKGELFLRVLYQFLPQEYFEYILSHFREFMRMYLLKGKSLLEETFQSLRGDYYLPYSVLAGIVLLMSKREFSYVYKGYQIFLYLCVLGMIVLVGYTLTPPDYGQIGGISYRYMLPALPIVGVALPLGNEKTESYVNQLYPMVLVTVAFASCLSWVSY